MLACFLKKKNNEQKKKKLPSILILVFSVCINFMYSPKIQKLFFLFLITLLPKKEGGKLQSSSTPQYIEYLKVSPWSQRMEKFFFRGRLLKINLCCIIKVNLNTPSPPPKKNKKQVFHSKVSTSKKTLEANFFFFFLKKLNIHLSELSTTKIRIITHSKSKTFKNGLWKKKKIYVCQRKFLLLPDGIEESLHHFGHIDTIFGHIPCLAGMRPESIRVGFTGTTPLIFERTTLIHNHRLFGYFIY